MSSYKSSISTNAIVTSNGNVTWLSMVIFRSSCAIDVKYFPFDEQNCTMMFASWTYDGFQVRHSHLQTILFANCSFVTPPCLSPVYFRTITYVVTGVTIHYSLPSLSPPAMLRYVSRAVYAVARCRSVNTLEFPTWGKGPRGGGGDLVFTRATLC